MPTIESIAAYLKEQGEKTKEEPQWMNKSPLMRDETKDPCLKEGNLSNRCMYENNYRKELCLDAFDNYKICKRFWRMIETKRRYLKIKPSLPPPEERERVKVEEVDLMIEAVKEQMKS